MPEPHRGSINQSIQVQTLCGRIRTQIIGKAVYV